MQKYAALERLSGADFDREFSATMVKDHQEDIAKYEKQAKSGNSKVAKLAEETVPTLEHHLATAQRLQAGGNASHDHTPN